MTTKTYTFETRKLSPKNIVKYPNFLSIGKRALNQNIMNLRRVKIFFSFYLNLRFVIKSPMAFE